jgi:hypothetical protein
MLCEDLDPVRAWLDQTGTAVLGLNAFPLDAFHAEVVKHDVYRPHWADPARLNYTLAAAEALASLLPSGGEAGLTTVPIGWPDDHIDQAQAAAHLRDACLQIDALSASTGKTIHLAIEPEPGCVIGTAEDLARFVSTHQLHDLARNGLLRACLDACHLAVMHESPREAVSTLAAMDISVGRLQLSSAPQAETAADFAELDEPRWLHQTSLVAGGNFEFWTDLPEALAQPHRPGVWRTHLHVPIHLQHVGPLRTTQSMITDLLRACVDLSSRPALEVETYAWSVLPADTRADTLGDDIAAELRWAEGQLKEVGW